MAKSEVVLIIYYYCIVCKTSQHKSCVERRKKCEEMGSELLSDEEHDIIIQLRQIIAELQVDYINKLKEIKIEGNC